MKINITIILILCSFTVFGSVWEKQGVWSSWHVLESLEAIQKIISRKAKNPHRENIAYLEIDPIQVDNSYPGGERWVVNGFSSYLYENRDQLISYSTRSSITIFNNDINIQQLKETADLNIVKWEGNSIWVRYNWMTFSSLFDWDYKREFHHAELLKFNIVAGKVASVETSHPLSFKQKSVAGWDREIQIYNPGVVKFTGACNRATVQDLNVNFKFTNVRSGEVIEVSGKVTLDPKGIKVTVEKQRSIEIPIDCS